MLKTYEHLIQGLLEKGFASVDNWLTSTELIDLRKSLLEHQSNHNFHQAGIGNKDHLHTLTAIRNDNIFWLDPSKANATEQQFFIKVNNFIDYLNQTCYAGIRSFEFQYAIYDKGSFYKKHVDRFRNDDKRQFSMVFYLTENWFENEGGELRIYTDDAIIDIQPTPGRMVFFRSDLPHEVLISHHQRLSLTGWMKSN